MTGPEVCVAVKDYVERVLGPLRDVTISDVKVTWTLSTGVSIDLKVEQAGAGTAP